MNTPVKTFWVEKAGYRKHFLEGGERDFADEKDADNCVGAWDWGAPLYRLPDGSVCISSELPPGAVYQAPEGFYPVGPDGISIMVVCPDRWQWCPDSRASNCTLKQDNVHRCWCRHGDPRKGTLHIDKVGKTCAAGAGSVITGRNPPWHGFLHNGQLVRC